MSHGLSTSVGEGLSFVWVIGSSYVGTGCLWCAEASGKEDVGGMVDESVCKHHASGG